MTNRTLVVSETDLIQSMRPQRMAWSVLLGAFALFCLLCVLSTFWVHFFLFRSSLDFDSVLRVGRGTVAVSIGGSAEQAETQVRQLESSSTITTDRTDTWAQATVVFSDPNLTSSVLAVVTLQTDTSLTLERARRPRFDWSWSDHEIALADLRGELQLEVFGEADSVPALTVQTITGAEVRIDSPGAYVIRATDLHTRLTTHSGEAILIAADRTTAASIPSGQSGVSDATSDTIERETDRISLIQNSVLLGQTTEETQRVGVPPLNWDCTNGPSQNLPLGQYGSGISPDGRESFRMVRSGADSNGFTRCIQTFGASGIDVSSFDSLSLQVKMFIEGQSLNGCGTFASECPVMLTMKYLTSPGSDSELEWIHGVYARPIAPQDWPRQCGTCLQGHIEINPQTWYLYDSGNLFTALPEDRRPIVITQIEFFAEGHNYEVFFDEVNLVATSSGQPTITTDNAATPQ